MMATVTPEPQLAAAPPHPAPSRLSGQFYLLFIAGLLSDIGTFASETALFLHVYKLSGYDTSYVGLMAMADMIPTTVFLPVGGILAERYARKRVMIVNDLVRTPLILLMMSTRSPWILIGLQWLVSTSTAMFTPARQSLLPEVVPEAKVQLANSLVSGVSSVVHVLGPALGALLYSFAGNLTGVVAIDASSYLLSASLILALRPVPRRSSTATEEEGFLHELRAGLRYVRGQPDLWLLLGICLVAGMANGLSTPLFRPFTDEVLHGHDRMYSYMLVAFGVGGLIGPLVGYRIGRRLGLGRALLLLYLGDALLMLVWSRVAHPYWSFALILVWGANEFATVPCATSYIHQFARRELMSRTFSLFGVAEYLPQIVAATAISFVGNRVRTQTILTAAAIGYVGIMLLAIASRSGRLLGSRRGQALQLARDE
jgi:predicted MFS family arabinose efflux permease